MSIPCNVCENGNATCLHKVNIFQNLDLAQIEAVQKLIVQRKLTNGETLLFEGDLSDKLFIVRYGAIKLVRYGSDGREYVLDTLFPATFTVAIKFLQVLNFTKQRLQRENVVFVLLNENI